MVRELRGLCFDGDTLQQNQHSQSMQSKQHTTQTQHFRPDCFFTLSRSFLSRKAVHFLRLLSHSPTCRSHRWSSSSSVPSLISETANQDVLSSILNNLVLLRFAKAINPRHLKHTKAHRTQYPLLNLSLRSPSLLLQPCRLSGLRIQAL